MLSEMDSEVLKRELIGLEIEVADSRNTSDKGIKGKIIDETKNCLIIKTKDKEEKRLIKENITFRIPSKGIEIKGDALTGRAEERIKKRIR